MEHLIERVKICIDAISFGTVAATLVGWLPSIAAGFSILWILVQLYDREQKRRKG